MHNFLLYCFQQHFSSSAVVFSLCFALTAWNEAFAINSRRPDLDERMGPLPTRWYVSAVIYRSANLSSDPWRPWRARMHSEAFFDDMQAGGAILFCVVRPQWTANVSSSKPFRASSRLCPLQPVYLQDAIFLNKRLCAPNPLPLFRGC